MITRTFETKEEWLEARKGKFTGSRLKDIIVKRGTDEKIGFYETIAERIAEQSDGENPMERGVRLEDEAMQLFMQKTRKDVDTSLVLWEREDIDSIAVSPDGFICETEAVEIKCLSSARHIEAIITKQIPDEYSYQVIQYFIVNEKLEKLHFALYDPRMPEHLQLYVFEVTRESQQEQIDFCLAYQKEKIAKIEQIINELTF